MNKIVSGFSKLTKSEKIDWLLNNYLSDSEEAKSILKQYWNPDEKLQKLHDEFIENTISNFYLPLGIAPNFVINGKPYAVPMVIEESSVVAAASKAAKFWSTRGGFKAEVISTVKIGQVHFRFDGDGNELITFFNQIKSKFYDDTLAITSSMVKRGGGILDIELRDKTDRLKDYYQLHATFETQDAMGANFINSCLEQFAEILKREFIAYKNFSEKDNKLEVIMSILSNYTPNCLVKASVSCDIKELDDNNFSGKDFVSKFIDAVKIAEVEPYRAVTHNKGIMNGIDAVVLATGNDFRSVEAGIQAFASKDGQYKSLTHASLDNERFTFSIEIPLALGTVGGLTNIHPLVKVCLQILDNPTAKELMKIVAVVGLAQNFGAVKSLVTTGIQKGHMKMHLLNILNRFGATETEKKALIEDFKTKTVTHTAVSEALETIRK
ncbi:3-hydroxy-3-methylglutaryl-coenzyme A reductase [Flavobacteriaceae bacterium MAR_2010_188]|nr:3-hydroxy-3-methylglutaryl-coenzyme A reductase [Flavobacteriaceae bacterium MAR_2010_188]